MTRTRKNIKAILNMSIHTECVSDARYLLLLITNIDKKRWNVYTIKMTYETKYELFICEYCIDLKMNYYLL